MQFGEIALLAAAGLAAGTINTIVGSGSLVTFPALLALGYPPLVANVSNTVGLLPGSVSGAIGYRRELRGQAQRARLLIPFSMAGGATGAGLLLLLPASSFNRVVPFLILAACGLIAFQTRLTAIFDARHDKRSLTFRLALPSIYLTGVYGGYFGAAQGVILVALLGIFLPDDLQRTNALKNVLAAAVNGVAALLFALLAPVNWSAALVLAIGAVAGGQLGAVVGRRLPAALLRWVIVVVGTAVAIRLLVG